MLGSFIARLLPAVAYLTNVVSGLQWAGSGKVIRHLKKITLGLLLEGLTWLCSPEALLPLLSPLSPPPHIPTLLLFMGPLHHEGDLDRWLRSWPPSNGQS